MRIFIRHGWDVGITPPTGCLRRSWSLPAPRGTTTVSPASSNIQQSLTWKLNPFGRTDTSCMYLLVLCNKSVVTYIIYRYNETRNSCCDIKMITCWSVGKNMDQRKPTNWRTYSNIVVMCCIYIQIYPDTGSKIFNPLHTDSLVYRWSMCYGSDPFYL